MKMRLNGNVTGEGYQPEGFFVHAAVTKRTRSSREESESANDSAGVSPLITWKGGGSTWAPFL